MCIDQVTKEWAAAEFSEPDPFWLLQKKWTKIKLKSILSKSRKLIKTIIYRRIIYSPPASSVKPGERIVFFFNSYYPQSTQIPSPARLDVSTKFTWRWSVVEVKIITFTLHEIKNRAKQKIFHPVDLHKLRHVDIKVMMSLLPVKMLV